MLGDGRHDGCSKWLPTSLPLMVWGRGKGRGQEWWSTMYMPMYLLDSVEVGHRYQGTRGGYGLETASPDGMYNTISILEWRLTQWNLLRNSLSHRKSCNVSNNHNYMAWQVDYLVISVHSWLFLFVCIAMSKPYRYSKCLALHRRSNSCVKTILLSYETTRSCMGRYFALFAWSYMNVLIFCWSTSKGGWRRCRADAQFTTDAPNLFTTNKTTHPSP